MRYIIPLLFCLAAFPAWASPANSPFSFQTPYSPPYLNTANPQPTTPGYGTQTQQQNSQTQQQGNQQGGGVTIPQNPVIPTSPPIPGASSTVNSPVPAMPVPTLAQHPMPEQNIPPGSHQQPPGGAGGTGGSGGASGQKGPDTSGLTNIVGKIFSNSQDITEQNKRKTEEKAQEKQVQEELQKKIEYMDRNNYQNETLPEAIYKKQYEQGNRHLPKAVYESDYDGLLFTAVESGDDEALRAVIMRGRSLEVRNRDGDTPLLLATLIGNVDGLRILLEHGADVDAQNLKNGVTALQIAAYTGNEKLTRLLLEMDADPGIKNAYGKTALQQAEAKSNYGVALLILARSSELAFSGGEEEIKRLHRRQEDKRERELRALGQIPAPNPAAGIVKEIAAELPAKQPKPEERKLPLPPQTEESVKDRIQRFLASLVGQEKAQEKQTAAKKQKENQQAADFEQNTAMPIPPVPAAPEIKPASASAPTAITFKRSTPLAAKFFIPGSLFSEAIETEINSRPVAAPVVVEKLPGEDEPLPTNPPKIDLPEVINSLVETEDNTPPAPTSPVISERRPGSPPPPANNSASPGLPLRSNGSAPVPPAITPLQPMPAGKNNVMIPNQPGINNPLGH